MEENNRKGPGIFYAVTGVATLVVAIIGATFAYFSASDTNDEITGNIAAAGGLYLDVVRLAGTGEDIIPLNVNATPTSSFESEKTSQFEAALTNACVDTNGNQVCEIYGIFVANKSATSTIQVQGQLTLTSEADNLMWKLIDVTPTGSFAYDPSKEGEEAVTNTITYNNVGAANLNASDWVIGENSSVTGPITAGSNKAIANQKLGFTTGTSADNVAVYYVMIWLEETGSPQENADALKDYDGLVSFTAVDALGNASGITATF